MTESPFPGPSSFTHQERKRFFGREKEQRDLTDLVLAYPLVVLCAPSGAGKTSLVRAGVAPRAECEGALVLLTRLNGGAPEETPLIANVFAFHLLAGLGGNMDGLANLAFQTRAETLNVYDGVVAALRLLGVIDASSAIAEGSRPESSGSRTESRSRLYLNRPVVLVVDQFEELFTAHQARWRDREPFLHDVARLVSDVDDLHILISVRSDYVSDLELVGAALPGGLRIRYLLERLRKQQAIDAIRKPLSLPGFGCILRTRLVEGIVSDLLRTYVVATGAKMATPVEGEFVEPLHLQIVASGLWTLMQRAKPLTDTEQQQAMIDDTLVDSETDLVFSRDNTWFRAESGTIRDVDATLRGVYDAAVERAAPFVRGGQRQLRRLFSEDLITLGGTRGFVDRISAKKKGVSDIALRLLEEDSVLRREPRAGAEWYELTHDRFVAPVQESNRDIARRLQLACLVVTTVIVLFFGGTSAGVLIHHSQALASKQKALVEAAKVALEKQQLLTASAERSAAAKTRAVQFAEQEREDSQNRAAVFLRDIPRQKLTALTNPLGTRGVLGIAVSHYSGAIEWSKVKAAGVSFVYEKASEGTGLTDPMFARYWSELKRNGIRRGAYHFFRPNGDVAAQVKLFVSAVGNLEKDDLPPVLDLELSDGLSPDVIVAHAMEWLRSVEKLLGRRPMVYTGGFARNILGQQAAPLGEYPLWTARYSGGRPLMPIVSWTQWTIWDFTDRSSVPGIPGSANTSVFNGSEREFVGFIHGSE